MQHLFFDMECADGNHICSVGYVRADEEGNVLEKKDILIHPDCKFALQGARRKPYIQLAYPADRFYANPKFAARYDMLRALLCDSDRVYWGHSIASDLAFLEKACTRYRLPQLLLNVFDTQAMYARFCGDTRARALETIVSELGVDVTHLTEHKSCDDAEMSLLVAKTLAKQSGCSLSELAAAHPDCIVHGKDIVVAAALRELKKQYAARKRAPGVFISKRLDGYDIDGRIRLLRALYERGFSYARVPAKCRYYVSNDIDDCPLPSDKNNRRISTDALGKMLHVPVDENACVPSDAGKTERQA